MKNFQKNFICTLQINGDFHVTFSFFKISKQRANFLRQLHLIHFRELPGRETSSVLKKLLTELKPTTFFEESVKKVVLNVPDSTHARY